MDVTLTTTEFIFVDSVHVVRAILAQSAEATSLL